MSQRVYTGDTVVRVGKPDSKPRVVETVVYNEWDGECYPVIEGKSWELIDTQYHVVERGWEGKYHDAQEKAQRDAQAAHNEALKKQDYREVELIEAGLVPLELLHRIIAGPVSVSQGVDWGQEDLTLSRLNELAKKPYAQPTETTIRVISNNTQSCKAFLRAISTVR